MLYSTKAHDTAAASDEERGSWTWTTSLASGGTNGTATALTSVLIKALELQRCLNEPLAVTPELLTQLADHAVRQVVAQGCGCCLSRAHCQLELRTRTAG